MVNSIKRWFGMKEEEKKEVSVTDTISTMEGGLTVINPDQNINIYPIDTTVSGGVSFENTPIYAPNLSRMYKIGGLSSTSDSWIETLNKEYKEKLENINKRMSELDATTKAVLDEIKPLVEDGVSYTFMFVPSVKKEENLLNIGLIIERHVQLSKFTNKLDDILSSGDKKDEGEKT